MTIDFEALAAPFAKTDVKTFKKANRALSYITARHVMNRLDKVAGPANWRDDYQVTALGVVCTLYLRVGEEWVGKSDIGDTSDIEPEKGAFSGAFKRAAVRWGIGRELYGDGTAYDDDPEPQRKPAHDPETGEVTRDPAPELDAHFGKKEEQPKRASKPKATNGNATPSATEEDWWSSPQNRQDFYKSINDRADTKAKKQAIAKVFGLGEYDTHQIVERAREMKLANAGAVMAWLDEQAKAAQSAPVGEAS